MKSLEEEKKILQKAVTLGNLLRDMERSDGFKAAYKPWLESSIERRANALPDQYAKLTDKEYGVQVGITIGLREALEYIANQIKKADEAAKKLGGIDGRRS